MKKHRRSLAIGLVAISLMLSGCGTQLYELTAEEEELIVQYAAYYIAKHNIYQADGVSNVYIDEDEVQDSQEQDTQTPDNSEDDGTGTTGDGSGAETPDVNTVTLAEAIGMSQKLAITYKGSSIEEYIKQGAGYSANPHIMGNVLYVMKFEVKNISEQSVELDHLTSKLGFKLKNDIAASHRQTYLSNDFSSYVGTIDAGATVEMILIFEAAPADAQSISKPILQITVDDVSKIIEL